MYAYLKVMQGVLLLALSASPSNSIEPAKECLALEYILC
jgi:hypothetical protein